MARLHILWNYPLVETIEEFDRMMTEAAKNNSLTLFQPEAHTSPDKPGFPTEPKT